jgi:hypothetical protein
VRLPWRVRTRWAHQWCAWCILVAGLMFVVSSPWFLGQYSSTWPCTCSPLHAYVREAIYGTTLVSCVRSALH